MGEYAYYRVTADAAVISSADVYCPAPIQDHYPAIRRFIQGFMYYWIDTVNGWKVVTHYRPNSLTGPKSLGRYVRRYWQRYRVRLPSTYG